MRGGRDQPLNYEPQGPIAPVDHALTTVEEKAQDRERTHVMRRFLDDVLERIEPSFKNRKHRAIFGMPPRVAHWGTEIDPIGGRILGRLLGTDGPAVQKAFDDAGRP